MSNKGIETCLARKYTKHVHSGRWFFCTLIHMFPLGFAQNITNTKNIYIYFYCGNVPIIRKVSTLALENIDKNIRNMTLQNVH
jgi:hypothetical protein